MGAPGFGAFGRVTSAAADWTPVPKSTAPAAIFPDTAARCARADARPRVLPGAVAQRRPDGSRGLEPTVAVEPKCISRGGATPATGNGRIQASLRDAWRWAARAPWVKTHGYLRGTAPRCPGADALPSLRRVAAPSLRRGRFVPQEQDTRLPPPPYGGGYVATLACRLEVGATAGIPAGK